MTQKLHTYFCCFLLIALSTIQSQAQEQQVEKRTKRPTVALVLSGGGAKGFAEIGTLEAIDELGIPIDYVIGTSMGSIMGGLYAIGYSGKTIAEEVPKQDWQNVFNDKIVSSKTPISLKDELSRYAFSFPMSKGIQLPKGIVRGQEVMNIISKYTIGYHGKRDFNKLPIPYSCVAVDIETGEAVVLEQGHLPTAMRASMAIPSVFTPVEINGRLFVDGGVINNFPTDIAKIKGYDYVIGVNVQSPLRSKDELNSAADIAKQLISFSGTARTFNNIKNTDVYIHPDISQFSTGSFSPEEIDSLIEVGRRAAREAYPQLKKLKEKLGNITKEKKHFKAPDFEKKITFKNINIEGLRHSSKELFRRKLRLHDIDSISTDALKVKIDDVSSILNLDLLNYNVNNDTLTFIAHERNNNRFNVGLHYDSDNSSSLLLNTTWNNILFDNSRVSVDLILGKNSAISARYIIKLGSVPYLNFDVDAKRYTIKLHEKNSKIAEGDFRYVKFDVNAQMILWDNYSVGFGLRQEFVKLDNTLSNLESIPDKIKGWYTNYYGLIKLNTLNDNNYPTQGMRFDGEAKYITNHKGEAGEIVYANYQRAININKKFSAVVNVYGRTLLESTINGIYENYWGGINQTNYLDKHLPFVGANWTQGTNNTMTVGRIDLSYQLFNKNYLILSTNYGRYSDDTDVFFTEQAQNILGAGITYSYDSIIGPISLTVMHSTEVERPLLHVSIGHNF